MACFNDSHLTALTSSIGSRRGPPMTRICQNCTILIRPSTEYNIEPRNPWTETSCPVSSNTSRLAAASACSPGLSLPFGSTQDLLPRNRTMAIRGLEPSRKTIPPAARTGAWVSAESVISMLCRTNARRASAEFPRNITAPPANHSLGLNVALVDSDKPTPLKHTEFSSILQQRLQPPAYESRIVAVTKATWRDYRTGRCRRRCDGVVGQFDAHDGGGASGLT
jgi:hypothetical protein